MAGAAWGGLLQQGFSPQCSKPIAAACSISGGDTMDAAAIQAMLGVLPGGGIAALAVWFALKKDSQCTAMMEKMADLAKAQAVSASEVKTALDSIREAIRAGTGRS